MGPLTGGFLYVIKQNKGVVARLPLEELYLVGNTNSGNVETFFPSSLDDPAGALLTPAAAMKPD